MTKLELIGYGIAITGTIVSVWFILYLRRRPRRLTPAEQFDLGMIEWFRWWSGVRWHRVGRL